MGWFSRDGKMTQPPPARLSKKEGDEVTPEEIRKGEKVLESSSWSAVHSLKKALLLSLSIARLRMPKKSLNGCSKGELTDMLMEWVSVNRLDFTSAYS